MKVFISQPMMGKTNAEINDARGNTIRFLESKGYEIIDSVFDFDDVECENKPLFYLAKAISLIAEKAYMVYFMRGWENARGCKAEHYLCKEYGVSVEYED